MPTDYEEFRTFDSDQVYRVPTFVRLTPRCLHESIQTQYEYFSCADCGKRLTEDEVRDMAERLR